MDEYGNDFIVLTDEDGNEVELEHMDTVEYNGEVYMAFIPAEMSLEESCELIMSLPVEEIFQVKAAEFAIPHRARLMESITCEDCGEVVMESRIRRLEGKYYCISCFKKHDDR